MSWTHGNKTYTTGVLVVGGCEKFSAEQKTNQMVKTAFGSTSCSLPRSLLAWYLLYLSLRRPNGSVQFTEQDIDIHWL